MKLDTPTPGVHHVTAIAGDPQANLDFYVGTLGMRFVKKTVNHDDRYTYHFYFGDGEGTPGTNVTFFPWGESAQRGRVGTGQVATTAFLIPPDAVDYWTDRLDGASVEYETTDRFDERVIAFEDPDGIELELVATDETPAGTLWADSPVPEDGQIRGFAGVTLSLADREDTADVIEALGFARTDEAADRWRYRADDGRATGVGAVVDLVQGEERGRQGAGTVHHVAFAAEDDEHQQSIRRVAVDRGLRPTEVVDRKYFRSIYFREPGGVLFEVATNGPGFAVDEDVDALGERLVLPEWLEDERETIEARLPELRDPLAATDEA